MSISMNNPNQFGENPLEDKVKTILKSVNWDMIGRLRRVIVTVAVLFALVSALCVASVLFGDDPLAAYRRANTVTVKIVRTEQPPAHDGYRLITENGKVMNCEEPPEVLDDIRRRGLPLKATLSLDKNGNPVNRSAMAGIIPGILLAVLMVVIQLMVDGPRTPKKTAQQKIFFIVSGALIQMLALISGILSIVFLFFWSPWLLLGLVPVAANLARLRGRTSDAVGMDLH